MLITQKFARLSSASQHARSSNAHLLLFSCGTQFTFTSARYCPISTRSNIRTGSHLNQLRRKLSRSSSSKNEKAHNSAFLNFSDVKPSQVPDAIIFEHKYRPIRYPFWKPWFARFAVWSLMRKYPGSSVTEITEGALQAFQAIYPILNPASTQPLPPAPELEKMMEPHIVKQLVKHRQNPETLKMEIGLVKIKKIVLADCKMGMMFRKDVNPMDSYKSWEARSLAPRFITPVFIITTEEEVKSVCNVPQRSRTRFFELDHIYGFRTLLPPMAHHKRLPIAEALEKTPIHWRVAMLRSDYGSVFAPKKDQPKPKIPEGPPQ